MRRAGLGEPAADDEARHRRERSVRGCGGRRGTVVALIRGDLSGCRWSESRWKQADGPASQGVRLTGQESAEVMVSVAGDAACREGANVRNGAREAVLAQVAVIAVITRTRVSQGEQTVSLLEPTAERSGPSARVEGDAAPRSKNGSGRRLSRSPTCARCRVASRPTAAPRHPARGAQGHGRLLRLIRVHLAAGVMVEGARQAAEEGAPPGPRSRHRSPPSCSRTSTPGSRHTVTASCATATTCASSCADGGPRSGSWRASPASWKNVSACA